MGITSGVRFYATQNYSKVLKYNWEKIPFELEGEASELQTGVKYSIATQTCKLSKEEFNDFLTLYPIPSEYHVILPKSNQTIFDALPGFIYLGLTLLVMPSSPLLLSCARLMVVSPLSTSSEEMAFRNFFNAKDDEDLLFCLRNLPRASALVTIDSRESLKPEVFVVHLGSVAARIKDRKCKTRGGLSRPPVMRKFAPRSSTSSATRAKTSSLKDDVPFLIVSDDDEAVVDNAVNRRSRELLQVIKKLKGEFDVMKDMEWDREEECEELWVKCEAAMTEFEKNPTVVALQEKISTLFTEVKEHKAEKVRLEAVEVSLRKEVEELKQDRREVVSKVVPYATMELVYSDHMSSLVGRLVSSAIFYRRCRAYEQVADMKEPFDLSKVKDPRAPIEALLSKKPPSLQRPAPSRTQVPLLSSQRVTPSSVLVFNLMSPPADISVVKPQSSQLP
ncbi:hypothetical protein Tco_1371510 [Tanacetum coccineum]